MAPRSIRLWPVFLGAIGAVVGLVAALIVLMNVHQLAGLEAGYAATPADVLDLSIFLAAFDVVLLLVGPVGGAVAAVVLLRQARGADEADRPMVDGVRPSVTPDGRESQE